MIEKNIDPEHEAEVVVMLENTLRPELRTLYYQPEPGLSIQALSLEAYKTFK